MSYALRRIEALREEAALKERITDYVPAPLPAAPAPPRTPTQWTWATLAEVLRTQPMTRMGLYQHLNFDSKHRRPAGTLISQKLKEGVIVEDDKGVLSVKGWDDDRGVALNPDLAPTTPLPESPVGGVEPVTVEVVLARPVGDEMITLTWASENGTVSLYTQEWTLDEYGLQGVQGVVNHIKQLVEGVK